MAHRVGFVPAEETASGNDRHTGADQLGDNECRRVGRSNTRKGIGERARDGDRGVGERGGRGEPVGRGDVEADGIGDRRGIAGDAGEDGEHEAEGRHQLAEPLARPFAHDGAGLEGRQAEHQVRDHNAGDRTEKLGGHVRSGASPAELPP